MNTVVKLKNAVVQLIHITTKKKEQLKHPVLSWATLSNEVVGRASDVAGFASAISFPETMVTSPTLPTALHSVICAYSTVLASRRVLDVGES